MDRERFEELVQHALESLPEEFLERLENVDVVVADEPTRDQLKTAGVGRGYSLLGLYEGIPLTQRHSHYGMVVPDKISVFQWSIEAKCSNDDEIVAEVGRVVRHEIAHHFGISDERLDEIEGEE